MFLKLWPKDFENNTYIDSSERFLLRNASKNLVTGYFVIGIDPVGMSSDKMHLGMYISPKEGLISFSIVPGKLEASQINDYLMRANMIELAIYKRLIDSKVLIVRQDERKVLKFPYKHVLVFPEEDVPVKSCKRSDLFKISDFATVKFFVPVLSNERPKTIKDLRMFDKVRCPYYSNYTRINDKECMAIFERLAPEYTLVLREKDEVSVPVVSDALPKECGKITGKEVEYRTFFLDDYQVSMINDMGGGHRVLLANAGAGKSVLLLSKAIKYAGVFKDENVLLTCYNNNLADYYRFKLDCAGLEKDPHRKLFALTFHKLVEMLFMENLNRKIDGYASDEQILECISLVKTNKIKTRFKAILIDEVQIFTPRYLELCYALLDDPSDCLFLMAGDLNQTVRTQSRRGDAPWKKIPGVKLDFTGRVKYMKRNYRNCPAISKYLNEILVYMNNHLHMFNMININEFEYDNMSNGPSRNVALRVETGIDRMQIQEKTIRAIHEISEKYDMPYSDIAVLYPMRENRALNYHIQYWIRDALEKAGIPFSFISSTEDSYKRSAFSETKGVVLSTIDSSLGLDFRAVVLTGLFPYTYIFDDDVHRVKLKGWDSLLSLNPDELENVKINMRKVYTACSRAREVLYVLSDAESGTVIDSILRKGTQGK